ncbi:MAG: type III pantothenate kinase [Actinobacteria bacterium]|nr:type III pantothenate kinase [Actinomycetota bacterium]
MLLAVDVGNTQTHIGMFSAAEIVAEWRTSTEPKRTADELALIFQEFLSFQGLSFSKQVTAVVIASVVPSLTAALREMVQRYFHFDPLIVEPGTKTGMPIRTDDPREVGADRLVNALAAYRLFGGPAVVVDFGTATTFDAVSDQGEYLGGAIAPGIQISSNALWTIAAQIQKVELIQPRSVIGKSTREAVRAGVLLGSAAMVDGMVERMQKELGGDARAIVTGGLAALIVEGCNVSLIHEPYLTLKGLKIVHELNAGD